MIVWLVAYMYKILDLFVAHFIEENNNREKKYELSIDLSNTIRYK